MSAIPGGLDTDQGPPMTIPLRYFVVGLAFLLAGFALGVIQALGASPGLVRLAHIHVLLAGWVCLTIMGAMTQFVPVWSGAPLHSRRLATVQLWLVAVGLSGFAAALLLSSVRGMIGFGSLMLVGFWLFAYNLGRTLAALDSYDVTERHFALALAFFVLATGLGLSLAVSFATPVFGPVGLSRSGAVGAHATLAVFGAVLTTVVGALYQLATMFTQTDLSPTEERFQRIETVAYPLGVLALAGGRLFSVDAVARFGGVLVALSLLGVGIVVGRCLWRAAVSWTPMLSRYAVVSVALVGWAVMTLPHWGRSAIGAPVRFGAPWATHLLAFGIVGFVVFGTVYHVVPFIIWVHRYSDLLGYERVPMIDDLYSDRLARLDFGCLFVGVSVLVLVDRFDVPSAVAAAGGVLSLVGAVLFVANMLWVLREHSPQPLRGIVFSSLELSEGARVDGGPPDETETPSSAGEPPAEPNSPPESD